MMSSLAEGLDGGLDELVRHTVLGQVARERDGLPAHLTRGLLGHVPVKVVDEDLRTLLRQQLGRGAADAARRAGHDRRLSVENSHRCSFSSL